MGRTKGLLNLLVCKVAKAADETAGVLSFQILILSCHPFVF